MRSPGNNRWNANITSLVTRNGLVETRIPMEFVKDIFICRYFYKYPKKNHVSKKAKNLTLPWYKVKAYIGNIS